MVELSLKKEEMKSETGVTQEMKQMDAQVNGVDTQYHFTERELKERNKICSESKICRLAEMSGRLFEEHLNDKCQIYSIEI